MEKFFFSAIVSFAGTSLILATIISVIQKNKMDNEEWSKLIIGIAIILAALGMCLK